MVFMGLQFSYFSRMGRGFAYDSARHTLEKHIENPVPESEFAAVVKQMAQLTPQQKIDALLGQGFDALLSFYEGTIAGFIAIRRDDASKTTHVFRVRTEPDYRMNGVAVTSLVRILDDAFESGHELVQAGRGKDPAMTAILESLNEGYSQEYDVQVSTGQIRRKA